MTALEKLKALRERWSGHLPPAADPRIGTNSGIHSPRRVEGAKYIQLGRNSHVWEQAWLAAYDEYTGTSYTPSLKIGDNVNIGAFACITCINSVTIEDDCLFSEYVYISDHTHGYSPEAGPVRDQPLFSKGGVVIGRNAFVGYRVSILPGVTLGCNCVVGAHSVVTRSFPDYSMLAGVPAVLLKTYSFSEHKWVSIHKESPAGGEEV